MQDFITQLLRKWNIAPAAWNLIVIIGVVLLGLLMSITISFFVKRKEPKPKRLFVFHTFLAHVIQPVSVLLPLFAFNLLLPSMQMNAYILKELNHVVEIGLILTFAWLFIRLTRVAQVIIQRRVNIKIADNLRQRRLLTQLMYIRRVLIFIIILLTTGAVLLTFDTMRKIGTGLLTGVGIGGIIIGFAAQRSLGNLLAGFQIAFTQPIRIDDEVIVENQFGWIEDITLTYVVVRIWDERRLVLPINYFIEKPFENWTRNTAQMHGSVFLYTDYSLPVNWLRQELMRIVENSPWWDKRHASLLVTDVKERVMELRAVVSGKNSGDVWNLRCHVRETLIKIINEQYPHCLPKTRTETDKAAIDKAAL